MNSRMNSGRGFQIPPENDFQIGVPLLPLTPGSPILPRSNGVSVERTNWHDIIGIPDRHLRETMNSGVIGPDLDLNGLMGQNGSSCESSFPRAGKVFFDQNVGSYAQNFGNDNPLAELFTVKKAAAVSVGFSANVTLSRNVNRANAPAILDSYSQVDSSWTEGNFTSLLLGGESPNTGLNHWIEPDGLPQMPGDGFPVPFRPHFNLSSPPRSEPDATSSTANSFPFAPVTPDHAKQFENHRNPNTSVDDSSSQEKDKLENLSTSVGREAVDNHSNELLQNIVESSSAVASTTMTEKNNFEGGDQGIDLNKTPQQKTPKRRKHRPKVIVEGKPKRARNPKTPNTEPKENPSGKRKCVRKKGIGVQANATPQTEVVEVQVPTSESKAKSSRRKLNFDLENEKESESQAKGATPPVKVHQENHAFFNLNLEPQATELCTETNNVAGARSACTLTQQEGSNSTLTHSMNQIPAEAGSSCTLTHSMNQKPAGAGSSCTITHSMNQMPAESLSFPERCPPVASPAAFKYNALNFIARCVNIRNASPYQKCDRNVYIHEHQHLQGGKLNRNISHPHNTCINLEETRKMTWQNAPQMADRNLANSNARGGLKREYHRAMKPAGPCTENQMTFPFLHQNIYQMDDHNRNSNNFGTGYSDPCKQNRMENGFHAPPCVGHVNNSLRQVATEGRDNFCTNSSTFDSRILESYLGGGITFKKQKNGINGTCAAEWSHSIPSEHNIQKQLQPSELHSKVERMAEKRPSGSTQANNITSLTVMANSHLPLSIPPRQVATSSCEQGLGAFSAIMSVNRHNMAPTSSNLVVSHMNKVLLQEQKNSSQNNRRPSTKTKGLPGKLQYSDIIHEITCRLQGLKITGRSKEIGGQEQNALVLYKGNGKMVPYEGFDFLKKRKPRPKVDLDPETNRIWKLLMGKEGNEATEAEDKGKEKWWEEERNVFQGRTDSFIARMHLVQGDRRFSRWKGSVVDSVIGVFLTQNVSDHLSSSAFMSLAARFPIRSNSTDQTFYQSGTIILAEEPEIRMQNPDDTIRIYEKIARQPVYKQASVMYHESSEPRTQDPPSGTGRIRVNEHIGIVQENASSSNSSDFFVHQVNKEIHSYSGSNSEAEDSTRRCKSNTMHGPLTLPHTRTASFPALHSPVTGNLCFDDRSTFSHQQSNEISYNWQIPRLDKFNSLKNSSTLTPSVNSNITNKQDSVMPPSHCQQHMTPDLAAQGVGYFGRLAEESLSGMDYTTRRIGHTAEGINQTIIIQNGVSIQAPIIGPSQFLAKDLTGRESTLQSLHHTGKDQFSLSTNQQERSGTFQFGSTLPKEPARPTEEVSTRQSGTMNRAPNDPKYKEGFGVEERTTVVKPEGEKRDSFEWDSLRKLVQPNGIKNERSKDTLDSMDYEALRRAHVNEISNAIKERGMNNMLADRIKAFLDRLVRDHESVDLEWLRDVPPDKAKDYLLSIRGLGLKSVECVRLLTLHHLAFPVDTNVGRIAVRLGWVPLQPLPESLQLHLLELYPMLESIQKYLWPRLCKLDQRTLYELHYQMITFGKVFCTKSKPNCNACPMRGDCRHFASAFASARLALLGPEEKGIVSSTIPIATEKGPTVAIKPMPLPPAGISERKEIGSVFRNCEPIVEEPATPEPETAEITQSDMEDAFYEDPDEIPTIKLNAEEFALNLQNYMQGNMELQEGDLSKALVALNTEAASIPAPKLKNVRTSRFTPSAKKGWINENQMIRAHTFLLYGHQVKQQIHFNHPKEAVGLKNQENYAMRKHVSHAIVRYKLFTNIYLMQIPCRTAMRGSFPLNGTYFQVNEMFADHESSLIPIDVPRTWIWNLPRRTVYFGTSVSTIFKGFICVRGFDQKTRAPRPLMARLHFPASKLAKTKNEDK
ncbi:HhH-GPD base excision DNA repair family protein [Actinidia rufa]|uniref:HhH-GPD base excision DNA repair family protein n=1 Tax=Actinidia rufa TaxID=165716 RepID=A0A7J0GLK6_9ERIC|nr:HhH-GPD base excision DNA repair family protein [Actinidia rufa]